MDKPRIRGGKKLAEFIRRARLKRSPLVDAGLFAAGKFPDGTPVAAVAGQESTTTGTNHMLTKSNIAAVREAFNAWLDEMETEPVKVTHGPMDVRITLVPPKEEPTADDLGEDIVFSKEKLRSIAQSFVDGARLVAERDKEAAAPPPWKAPYKEFKAMLAANDVGPDTLRFDGRRLIAQMYLAGMADPGGPGWEWEGVQTAMRILDPEFPGI